MYVTGPNNFKLELLKKFIKKYLHQIKKSFKFKESKKYTFSKKEEFKFTLTDLQDISNFLKRY